MNTLFSHKKKIWKETAFKELCSFFIDLLAFKLGKLCPGVGILFRFFDPGTGVLHLRAVPGGDSDRKKLVARGSARGGGEIVTGQIDTCIIIRYEIIPIPNLFRF